MEDKNFTISLCQYFVCWWSDDDGSQGYYWSDHQADSDPVLAHYGMLNTLRPRRNGQHFADDIFKHIFFNKNTWILIKISLKFVPKRDKPLSEPMMVNLFEYVSLRLNELKVKPHMRCHCHAYIYFRQGVLGRRHLRQNTEGKLGWNTSRRCYLNWFRHHWWSRSGQYWPQNLLDRYRNESYRGVKPGWDDEEGFGVGKFGQSSGDNTSLWCWVRYC